VEQGRSLVRAANTGVTALVDSRGRLVKRAPLRQSLFLDTGPVVLEEERTPYQRWAGITLRISGWVFCGLTAWFAAALYLPRAASWRLP